MLAPELQDYERQIDANRRDARDLVAGLSDAQFNWCPAPGRWSMAQCFDHLNVATRKTFPAFDRAIADARARGRTAPGPFRYGWFARWMIRSMEPPPRRRMRAPRIFTPALERRLADAFPEFLAVRDQLVERVHRAEGLDLQRVRVVSPVSRLLRMPLGAYFAFILAHERRHLWQAREVRRAAGFPGA